jgi:4-amino-4-deoxy-L-arabinose transferase-like glycosyltransferase
VTVWVQPAGSPLVEHDETRYAEIAREMLASGNYTVPHLNGVPWYEKPPLLFWMGAASMRVFGATPWAARLPARLAGLGTIGLLFLWVARESDRRRASLAAVITLGTPLGWGIAYLNIADGLLTFFVTAAILAGHAAMQQSTARARAALALAAGAASGAAFLTKGLIGFLFPAAILGIWAVLLRRPRQLVAVAAGGSVGALAVVLPWLVVVAQRNPEYLRFFIIREHFQRYASAVHQRQEPLFFAVVIFAAALAPVLGSFLSALFRRRAPYTESERLLVVWFAFIVLFFSFSKSQLASYVAPAMPAASAFVALRFGAPGRRVAAWLLQAMLATGLVVAAFLDQRAALMFLAPESHPVAIASAIALLAAVWLALLVARRDEWSAVPITFAGYAAVYAALVVAWPTGATAREMAALRQTIVEAQRAGDVGLVSYRTFVKGLPWLMRAPVSFVEPGGELTTGAATISDPDSPLAWTEARFWQRWKHDGKLMALVDERRISDFEQKAGGVPFIIARARRHLLLSNFDPAITPSGDPAVSTALYASTPQSTPVPIPSVPANVLAAARFELKGAVIVRSLLELAGSEYSYEIASGGARPRVVKVDPAGRVVYTEELVRESTIPPAVIAAVNRIMPGLPVAFVKRERYPGMTPEHYEVVLLEGRSLREIEVNASGDGPRLGLVDRRLDRGGALDRGRQHHARAKQRHHQTDSHSAHLLLSFHFTCCQPSPSCCRRTVHSPGSPRGSSRLSIDRRLGRPKR